MADSIIDCSGLVCPMPIVKASQGIKKINSGQTMEIIATDPAFQTDIEAWSKKTGNSLQSFKTEGDKLIALILKS